MLHWVVATCCYAPGLLLIAEQWRRAASRNVRKVTTVHINEFTKMTDKRDDKQPLLKEGGTLRRCIQLADSAAAARSHHVWGQGGDTVVALCLAHDGYERHPPVLQRYGSVRR